MIKSLKARGDKLSDAGYQVELLSKPAESIPLFSDRLESLGLNPLKPTQIEILQVNLGKMCNQACDHCHVDAGPDRKEIMTRDTMQLCLEALDKAPVDTVDLTGGAPELNPDFKWFVAEISKRRKKIIVRSNLTILVSNKKYADYPEFFKRHGVIVISSMPCYTRENVDKQRGEGVFNSSIEALRILNSQGYGVEGTGLELHLVYNPGGTSLPGTQEKLCEDYKRVLGENYGIVFNELYTLTNLPINRFLDYLLKTGNYEGYMEKLVNAFNPSAAFGVMCRNTISVGWDGTLYDCDFNQMLELKVNGGAGHIRDFDFETLSARNIVVNQHCYGCTAGAGSSCMGAIV